MDLAKFNFGLSFGTYLLKAETCQQAVKNALLYGYRSFDTAELHKNHADIAIGLELGFRLIPGLKREDVFITSKIHNYDQKSGNITEAVAKIIKELALENSYMDCILLHSPVVDKYATSWEKLCECQEKFNIKHIGVSNFSGQHMEDIFKRTGIKPYLNQLELHPRNHEYQKPIIDYCHQNDIIVQAHSALGSYLPNPIPATIDESILPISVTDLIKWYCVQKYPTIIKSKTEERIKSNMETFLLYKNGQDAKNEQDIDVTQLKLKNNDNHFKFDRFKY